MTQNSTINLILASSSSYRKELLSRLNLPFKVISPNIDESILPQESALQLVERLSKEKALIVAKRHSDCYVIGSDQIAIFNNQAIGKPGDFNNAKRQLQEFSEQQISFQTAITVINRDKDFNQSYLSETLVKFRKLTESEIENYLLFDKPFDCAGSFKVESLGVALFESIQSDDPTSLQGLPLLALCRLLRNAGLNVL